VTHSLRNSVELVSDELKYLHLMRWLNLFTETNLISTIYKTNYNPSI